MTGKDELKGRVEGVIVGLQNLKTTVWEVCMEMQCKGTFGPPCRILSHNSA